MFHSTCEIYAHIYELKRLKGEENADRPFIPDQSAILIRRLLLKPIRALFLSLSFTPFIDLSTLPSSTFSSPLLLSLSLSSIIFLVCCPSSPSPLEPGRSHLLSFLRTEIFMVCPISDVANRH